MTVGNSSNFTYAARGMSDAELELACEDQFSGSAPWLFWTSELYSLGKCLRYWTKYPEVLPLYVEADHGAGLLSNLFPRDFKSNAEVYFTWHPLKEKRYKDFAGKKVIRIMHPWIPYRRAMQISLAKNRIGTLVFVSHSTLAVKWEGGDSEEYFNQLKELPDKFQPVVLCLHMADINAGLHKELRRYGFPIVTAGNTLSTHFVDRFYDLVKDYSYATSQAWGSQVAYCVELGVPYFFLGKRPTLINLADENLPMGAVPRYWDAQHEEYDTKAENLFSEPVDRVTDEQREFVESILGLDSKLTRWQVSWILWREFFRHWRVWHTILRSAAVFVIFRLGLLPWARKMWRRIKSR